MPYIWKRIAGERKRNVTLERPTLENARLALSIAPMMDWYDHERWRGFAEGWAQYRHATRKGTMQKMNAIQRERVLDFLLYEGIDENTKERLRSINACQLAIPQSLFDPPSVKRFNALEALELLIGEVKAARDVVHMMIAAREARADE